MGKRRATGRRAAQGAGPAGGRLAVVLAVVAAAGPYAALKLGGREAEMRAWMPHGLLAVIDGLEAWVDGLAGGAAEVRHAPRDPAFAVPEWIKVDGSVRVIEFADLEELDERVPLVIRNSPAARWPGVGKWSAQYIQERVPLLKRVRMTKDKSSLFMYETEGKAMRGWDAEGEVIPPTNYERANLSSSEFFSSERPMYYSHMFQTFLEDKLDEDVSPRQFMFVVDDENNVGSPAEYTTNFWMSRHGIVAGLHYDFTHNMFAQVAGCKRFVLTPLHELPRLKLFPREHPNDRQSQLEVEGVAERLGIKLEATVADLGPGDLLYLPPGFGHRVAAFPCADSDFSISINTWSKSVARDVAAAITRPSLWPRAIVGRPETAEDGKNRIRAIGYYLSEVVAGVLPERTFTEVVAGLLSERFMAQPGLSEGLACEPFAADRCPPDVVDLAVLPRENPDLAAKIAAAAAEVVAVFDNTGHVTLHEGLREALMHEFVEALVENVISLSRACAYLRCLAVSQESVP